METQGRITLSLWSWREMRNKFTTPFPTSYNTNNQQHTKITIYINL